MDNSLLENLYNTYGMVIEKKETMDINEFLYDIEKENMGLILTVDVFDCKWHTYYNKYHSEHFCWVLEADNSHLVCALPYGKQYQFYDIKNLWKKEVIKYYKFGFEEESDKEKYTSDIKKMMKKVLRENTEGVNGISDIQQMNELRNDIAVHGINLRMEIHEIKEIAVIPIVRAFEWIAWSRINYCDFLIQRNENGVLNDLILQLKLSSDVWKGIKNYIIREIMRGRDEVDVRIVEYLDKAIEAEKNILIEIKKVIGIK